MQFTPINGPRMRAKTQAALDASLIELSQRLWDRIEEVAGERALTYEQMRAMGYPYARSRPQRPTPTGFVNRQSGEFFNAFKLELQNYGDSARIVIVNNDVKAAMLSRGTPRMVGRYYGAAIMRNMNEETVTALVKSFTQFVNVEVKRTR